MGQNDGRTVGVTPVNNLLKHTFIAKGTFVCKMYIFTIVRKRNSLENKTYKIEKKVIMCDLFTKPFRLIILSFYKNIIASDVRM